ncbi:hypothetical protein RN001_005767 [Aquatica leii]|uniref:Uncharacterized protein n=1 Tax=Aquatica leii TaxID=1421715 RepID=A0AAN7SPY7_9COLE|nr:hypothetical protein RN001_005767 [Aquatica leii]
MRYLKKRYRTIKDNNRKKTDRARITWEYFEAMDNIFAEDKTINFGETLSSREPSNHRQGVIDQQNDISDNSGVDTPTSRSSTPTKEVSTKKRKAENGQKSGSRGCELKKIAVPSQNLPALTTESSTSKAQSLQSNRAERYWNRQLMEAYPDGPCDQSEIDENNTEAEILAAQGLVNLLNSKQDVTEIDINSATNSLVEVRDAEIQVSSKRSNVCMCGKEKKLIPRKCKTENVPRNSTGMPAGSDVRNSNDSLAKVENAVQGVINFVPAVEWDSMLANNDPVAYMTSTSEISNNVGKGSNARLYAQSTFALNKSQTKWISVGLCAELQFDPVVKLMGKGQCITLTEIEWKTLVCYRSIITNSFAGYATTPSYHEVCGVKITMEWMNKAKKVLKMQRAEETIYLAYDSVHEMWKLCDLIMTRLELLKGWNINVITIA